ncbi:IclR family transcriptional regulator C-terminal domain-containing protein [Arthrobacter sp. NPDC058288]|uniref:IclR family transcriptional regulator domain-containing protein n=1 Tax=Arthrobacter sp. NPDC058288 TaxID=3346424 RepID=UPI0036F001D1
MTSHTITDRDAFRQEIERVREQGYALQDHESEMQLVALAVPVTDSAGNTLAVLAVAAPAFRLSAQELPALVPVLRKAAEELSARLPQ